MSHEANNVYCDAIILEDMSSKEDIISHLSKYLLQKGYVNDQYQIATLEREKTYPTGLPTEPIGIAVPHSKAENVIQSAVVMGISKKLVEFAEMGNAASTVNVGIIFLLALQGENRHLNLLKNIINFCKQTENVNRLYQVNTQSEACKILQSEILDFL